jgi:hypothetical protein
MDRINNRNLKIYIIILIIKIYIKKKIIYKNLNNFNKNQNKLMIIFFNFVN